jgi:hypothetical protein
MLTPKESCAEELSVVLERPEPAQPARIGRAAARSRARGRRFRVGINRGSGECDETGSRYT